jgi:Fur family ferric uptake transcriptional regulator
MVTSELQIFQEYIRQRGLRRTPEREEILREIFEVHGHFDVDGLYLQLKGKGSKVSKASIYRALPLFIDCGLIREVDFSEGHWHYEHIYGHAHHNHLCCLGCGEIQEFEEPALKLLEEQLAQKYDYLIKGHQLQVRGYCPACRRKDWGNNSV